MKKHILIRVLAALGGVTLWMLGLCALAETFFHIPVTGRIGQLLGARTPLAVLVTLLLAIMLCAFGVCSLLMLSSKRAAKRKGFVMQKGENGMIGVSVKSIEGLVQTCVKQHDVIASAEISVVERRDGIVILLNIEETAGVNIPLAVGALQKQIKQYVNTCTGVDVHEVRVMVENTEDGVVESPYTVEKPMVLTTAATAAELHHEAPAAAPEAEAPAVEADLVEEAPALETPVIEEIPAEEEIPAVQENVDVSMANVPVVPIVPVMPEIVEEEDDRPLHQRLFGAEAQPVFVPAPPELVVEPAAEEVVEEVPAEAAEEIPEEAPAAEGIDANAVLEVVEAIAHEEELLQEDEMSEEPFDEAIAEVIDDEEPVADEAGEELDLSAQEDKPEE